MEDAGRLYRSLRLIRRVEERIADVYPEDKIKSPIHLSIGQEAISVGVCDTLREDDYVSGTYRGHALYLARGGDLNRFMAEMYGKANGCTRGKGGSMHLVDEEHNMLGSSAVVATHIPNSLGYALKLKRDGKGQVIACFFGDGATEEGVFYESLNFASLKKLPILFVCENNALAIHAPLENRWAHPEIEPRVRGFGIPFEKIPDQDVFKIRQTAASMIERIRAGGGPEFIECHTYRWREHVGPKEDFETGYRSREEARKWIESDQMAKLAGMLDTALCKEIDAEIDERIDHALAFAEQSPFPSIEELETDVHAD